MVRLWPSSYNTNINIIFQNPSVTKIGAVGPLISSHSKDVGSILLFGKLFTFCFVFKWTQMCFWFLLLHNPNNSFISVQMLKKQTEKNVQKRKMSCSNVSSNSIIAKDANIFLIINNRQHANEAKRNIFDIFLNCGTQIIWWKQQQHKSFKPPKNEATNQTTDLQNPGCKYFLWLHRVSDHQTAVTERSKAAKPTRLQSSNSISHYCSLKTKS